MSRLTILPPMPARGFETYDADWRGRSVALGREEAMCGRDRSQLAFQDKQMAYIEQKLRELNGEDTEDVSMPTFVYTMNKNGAFYGASTKIVTKKGTVETFKLGHLASNGMVKSVPKGTKKDWPKLTHKPTVPQNSRYGRSTSTQKIEP